MPHLQPAYQMPYSYLISREGDRYKARDPYGRVHFSDDEAATVIQAAIDALTEGGSIFLTRGNYTITSPLIIRSKIWLRGEGIATVLTLADGANCNVIESPSGSLLNQAKISDLKIDGNKNNQTADNAATYLLNPVACRCENVYIYNVRDKGIVFYGESMPTLYGYWSTIADCHIGDCTTRGISVENCDELFIRDNSTGNCPTGIRLSAGISDVIGNKIVSATYGIDVKGESNNIIGNVIDTITYIGIHVFASNIIVGNYLFKIGYGATQNTYGIRMVSGQTVKGVLIFSNKIVGSGSYAYCGIAEASDSDENYIIGNRVTDFSLNIIKRGANSVVRDNFGYVTENSGTATIANGNTSVSVAHGLAGTPTLVTLGATHSEVADAVWSADATNITITVPSAVSADRKVSWYAEYKP